MGWLQSRLLASIAHFAIASTVSQRRGANLRAERPRGRGFVAGSVPRFHDCFGMLLFGRPNWEFRKKAELCFRVLRTRALLFGILGP